jgi:sugar phosphate isomerase/epimerase
MNRASTESGWRWRQAIRAVRDFVRLVEVDHPWVGPTVDVGHQSQYEELVARVKPDERSSAEGIRAYNDTTIAIIDGLREKVFHLHVHDIDPQTWKEHKPFGTGFVDYPRLIAKLREVRYRGLLMLEISGPAAEMPRYLAEAKRDLERFLL